MERMRPANGIDQKRLSSAPSRWGDPASTMRVLKPLTCRGASEARHRWQGGAYSPPAPLSKEERTTNYPSFPQIQLMISASRLSAWPTHKALMKPQQRPMFSRTLSCLNDSASVNPVMSLPSVTELVAHEDPDGCRARRPISVPPPSVH